MKIMIFWNRSWMYNCPVPWYTVVDEMSVDEMYIDELSWNLPLRPFVGLALPGLEHVCAESHWKYHTLEGYYTCSFSKKAHEKGCKCSLTFPLRNGILTFCENCTNKYIRVDKLGCGIHPLSTLGI